MLSDTFNNIMSCKYKVTNIKHMIASCSYAAVVQQLPLSVFLLDIDPSPSFLLSDWKHVVCCCMTVGTSGPCYCLNWRTCSFQGTSGGIKRLFYTQHDSAHVSFLLVELYPVMRVVSASCAEIFLK